MDFSFLLNFVPVKYAGYVSALIGVASAAATVVPDTNPVGKALHFVALNFGKATNASALPPVVEIAPDPADVAAANKQ